MQEMQVHSILGWEDPLEKELAIHFSVLAWKSHGQRTGRLQSMGLQRTGHNLATKTTTL